MKGYVLDIEKVDSIYYHLEELSTRLGRYYSPNYYDWFKALKLTPFESIKAVILGQDPYHGLDQNKLQANGLAFSVNSGQKIPPSLNNILIELEDDLGIKRPKGGDLTKWAQEGVLLLNSVLTVEIDKPGSHYNLGWEEFTDGIIKDISDNKNNVVFILWGKKAQTKETLIDPKKHLILKSSHPSPYSSNYGFFGSKPFSKTNEYLIKNSIKPIDWKLE